MRDPANMPAPNEDPSLYGTPDATAKAPAEHVTETPTTPKNKVLTTGTHASAAFNCVGTYLQRDRDKLRQYPMDFYYHDYRDFKREDRTSLVLRVYNQGTHPMQVDGEDTPERKYVTNHPESFGGNKFAVFVKIEKDEYGSVTATDVTQEWRAKLPS